MRYHWNRQSSERKRAIAYSGGMHLLLFILIVAGLPTLIARKPDMEPQAITVEVVPITGITNIKPSEQAPAKKPEPEKKAEAPKPTPPVAKPAPPPPPPPAPSEKKEEKKKEEKKPEEKKKPEKKDDDLLAILKSVKENAKKQEQSDKKKDEASENTSPTKSKSTQYNPNMPMSLSEKDAIRSQIAKCWSVPAGAKDAHGLIVVLRVQVAADGQVMRVDMTDDTRSRAGRDAFFRAAADSAVRAVRMCSPLKDLPRDKYDTWKDMELTFDPREMLF